MDQKNNTKNQKAFTLIELLIVIAIVSILAGIVAVKIRPAITKARYVKARDEMRAIKDAIYFMKQDTGKWPFGCIPSKDATATYTPPSYGEKKLQLNSPESGLWKKPVVGTTNQMTYEDGYTTTFDTYQPNACTWTEQEVNSWRGPYVSIDKLKDPWNGPYILDRNGTVYNTAAPSFFMYSWGFENPPDCYGNDDANPNSGFSSKGILYLPLNGLEFLPYSMEKSKYYHSIPGYC